LNQLAAVLATGNVPALLPATAALVPDGLPAAVRAAIRMVDGVEGAALDLALAESALLDALRLQLAARDGAIVNIIDTQADGAIPLWRLVAERALCVNTTAAGGNASLMTLGNG